MGELANSNSDALPADKDFDLKWRLVTSRYRKDSGEMRLTYANDLAWNHLNKGGKGSYPKGAIFGKVSFVTQEDIDFPSSLVPQGARRIQFMVRDEKKYPDTDGWGYSIFDAQGVHHPGDRKSMAMACAACHLLMKARGHVFSSPMGRPFETAGPPLWESQIKLVKVLRKALPSGAKDHLPANFGYANQIDGPMARHVFTGTLDEMRPFLIKKTVRERQPHYFSDSSGKLFVIAYPGDVKNCTNGVGVVTVHTTQNPQNPIIRNEVCESSNAR